MERVSYPDALKFISLTNTASFLHDLRKACLSNPGNTEFWTDIQGQGREMSLISKSEAAKQGGISSITEPEAEQVRPFWIQVLNLDDANNKKVFGGLICPLCFPRASWTSIDSPVSIAISYSKFNHYCVGYT